MDSGGFEDVLILAVDPSCDCLCLGGEKSKRNSFSADKGKSAVNLSRRAFTKKLSKVKTEPMAQESPVIILDDSSGSETDCIEMACAQPPLNDTAASDSSPFPISTPFVFKSEAVTLKCDTTATTQLGNDFCLLPSDTTTTTTTRPSDFTNRTVADSGDEALPPAAKKVQLSPPVSSLLTNTYTSNGTNTPVRNDMDSALGISERGCIETMETDGPCHQHTNSKQQGLDTTIPLTGDSGDNTYHQPQLMPTTNPPHFHHQLSSISSTDSDFEMAIKLDQELNTPQPLSKEDEKLLEMDEEMAKKLQQEEYLKGMHTSKLGDERLARNLLADELYAYSVKKESVQEPSNSKLKDSSEACSSTSTLNQSSTCDNNVSTSSSSCSSSMTSLGVGKSSSKDQLKRYPTCWTTCPNCAPALVRKYHLIDVEAQSAEWDVVTSPLTRVKFSVTRVQRIQNEALWQRLCFEKQLMLREREDVNEQLLYHTSRAEKAVICEEGLDPRLSRNGYFGVGMYFSDDPIKCNNYWDGRSGHTRRMFCCRVLLGHVKHYPRGKSDRLVREPPKENPRHGEPKTYDSVQGNITGQNEFVVYNAYRVMPEYVIEYCITSEALPPPGGPHPLPHVYGTTTTFNVGTTLVFHQTIPTPRNRGGKRKGRKRK